MIIRDFIIKEHRVLTEAQARAQLMEDPVFRHARQFGQLLVEYNLTKAQVQQLFKDVEQGATAAGSNRTGLGKAKDYTTKTIGNIISGARKWVKERPTYQAVDAEYNRAMTALGKLGGENGEANTITKAIYKYRDVAKQYPRATGLAKWAIITAAGLATGGVGGAGVAAGLAAIDSAIKDKEIVDIVGDAAAAALVSGAAQGAAELGGQALDAYRGLPSDAAVAANNAALGGFNDSGVPGGAASNINGLDLPANAATGDGTAMGDTTPSISGGQDIGGYNPDNVPGDLMTTPEPGWQSNADVSGMYAQEPGWPGSGAEGAGAGTGGSTYTVTADDFKGLGKIAQDNGLTAQQLWDANPQITDPNKIFIGQEINIPAASGEPVKNIWQDWEGPTKSTAPAVQPGPSDAVPPLPASNGITNLTKDFDPANTGGMTVKQGASPVSSQGFTGTSVAGMPVIPGQPLNPTQMALSDMALKMGNQLSPVVQAAYDLAKSGAVRESSWSKVAESVKVKVLPNNQLIDSKFTVYAWALNESTNREMGRSLQLTKLGVHTIFENIGRYRRAYLKEYIGAPTADYGHPTAPGAPASATAGQGKPKGWFGRGLDTIGRGVDAVGSWASNVGHNVITKVTADKLNNMWNRAGEPYDSDRLYQLLTTDWGVPKEVVDSVYQRMNLSAAPAATTAPSATPTGTTTPTSTGGTVTQTPTGQVHRARANNPNAAVANPATAAPAATTTPTTGTTKPATNTFPGEDPQGPGYVGRREVARRQAARGATASKPATPNFAGPSGYGKTTMTATGINPRHNYDEVTGKITPFGAARKAKRDSETAAFNASPKGKALQTKIDAALGATPAPTVEPTSMLGKYVNKQDTLSTGRAAIANNLKKLPADQLESLSWSRDFDPGMTLFRQMKREQS